MKEKSKENANSLPKDGEFRWYVDYELPGELDEKKKPVIHTKQIDAATAKEAELLLKDSEVNADRIQANIGITCVYWRKAGSKDEWYLCDETDGGFAADGGPPLSLVEELRRLKRNIKVYKEKPALLRKAEDQRYLKPEDFWRADFIPEFTTRVYKKGRIPEWLTSSKEGSIQKVKTISKPEKLRGINDLKIDLIVEVFVDWVPSIQSQRTWRKARIIENDDEWIKCRSLETAEEVSLSKDWPDYLIQQLRFVG